MNYKIVTNIDFNFIKILIIFVTRNRLNNDFNKYDIKKKSIDATSFCCHSSNSNLITQYRNSRIFYNLDQMTILLIQYLIIEHCNFENFAIQFSKYFFLTNFECYSKKQI